MCHHTMKPLKAVENKFRINGIIVNNRKSIDDYSAVLEMNQEMA